MDQDIHQISKIIALTTCMYNLDKKTSVLEKVQGGGVNMTQTCTNTKGKDPNNSYVDGLKNL